PMTQMHGVQQEAPRLLGMMPLGRPEQRDAILARLRGLPELIEQTIALLQRGLKDGVTPPGVCLNDVPGQIAAQVTNEPTDSPILSFLHGQSMAVPEAFREDAVSIYWERVAPAFEQLRDFAEKDYLPGCRKSGGWSELPDGRDWYRFAVRRETTTDMTPDEIFDLGMSEVKRIRAAMDEIISETGFSGDFDAFCEFLRTDPQFFFERAEDLVTAYRDIAKRADPELVKLFGTLPRLPYGVVRIPAYSEKSQTTAYYQPGSRMRPGYYFVNTYDLKSRPTWEMEALSLHEAVPGHHLQIALMQELDGLPEFRRQGWITAYGEGWALYAESLGSDMGFYTDPYSRFGQLTYEMWRAIRLVVDPAMHWKGWSRDEAIGFFRDNSSKSLHDIGVEIDRYLVWPGQALAYKVGELRIKEMRRQAEERLGDAFDVRGFHDELLGAGCLPLDLLAVRMQEWTRRQAERVGA
ncbi:DUF885 family protein, partial [candidate division GN15 bacterium]|nr:DUF885 family protein [candidate division GN15 bacterium]